MNGMNRLDGPLVLAGAGNMGGAMLAGWLARGLAPADIIVQDPGPPPATAELLAKHGVRIVQAIDDLPAPPSVLLMAVKPQVMDEIFAPLARFAGPATVVLSIAAGRTIASFEKFLPASTAVVRSIPNTPAAVGRGITVAAANAHTTDRHKQTVTELLSAIGEVAWVDDEGLIDPVTAVSGSGPAYVFHMVEALAAAGGAAGRKPNHAMQRARATVTRSGEQRHPSPHDAATQRPNRTSPHGTTNAAHPVRMA
jgi:pyrroline-5-carboxylate reductase